MLAHWRASTEFTTVVMSGLIAGLMLAIGIANHADRAQPEAGWTRRFQVENAPLTKTIPEVPMIPLIALMACCIAAASWPSMIFAASAEAMADQIP